MAAVHLGVFEALRDGAQSCDDLGRSLALDAEALELILRLLVGGGYLCAMATVMSTRTERTNRTDPHDRSSR
jgi:hypothetical protein